MLRSRDKLQKMKKQLECVLLSHGRKLFVSSPNQVFEHSWRQTALVWYFRRILGGSRIAIGLRLDHRRPCEVEFPDLRLGTARQADLGRAGSIDL